MILCRFLFSYLHNIWCFLVINHSPLQGIFGLSPYGYKSSWLCWTLGKSWCFWFYISRRDIKRLVLILPSFGLSSLYAVFFCLPLFYLRSFPLYKKQILVLIKNIPSVPIYKTQFSNSSRLKKVVNLVDSNKFVLNL